VAAIRDKLWFFGTPIMQRQSERDWLPAGHPMTAAEAAGYLGIPNVLWVNQKDIPEPPFDGYARPLAPMKQLVWSILGDSLSHRNDLEEVIHLSERFPNITGGIMDDFFRWVGQEGPVGKWTLEQVKASRDALHAAVRPLDLWVVIYACQLDLPSDSYLELCDVVTFWTWWAKELPELEANFAALERRAGDKRKLLGCYFVDFGDDSLMPLKLMEHQCDCGLTWLREGRLDGIIFLGNTLCGLGLETVEWTRDWIASIGDMSL
jgi:hypothetical protein